MAENLIIDTLKDFITDLTIEQCNEVEKALTARKRKLIKALRPEKIIQIPDNLQPNSVAEHWNMPVRLWNGLHQLVRQGVFERQEIEQVSDLTLIDISLVPRRCFFVINNLGEKSIRHIELLLSSVGLKFAE